MPLDPEHPCRQRPQDFFFRQKPIEPSHALIACQNRHLPICRQEIGIMTCREAECAQLVTRGVGRGPRNIDI